MRHAWAGRCEHLEGLAGGCEESMFSTCWHLLCPLGKKGMRGRWCTTSCGRQFGISLSQDDARHGLWGFRRATVACLLEAWKPGRHRPQEPTCHGGWRILSMEPDRENKTKRILPERRERSQGSATQSWWDGRRNEMFRPPRGMGLSSSTRGCLACTVGKVWSMLLKAQRCGLVESLALDKCGERENLEALLNCVISDKPQRPWEGAEGVPTYVINSNKHV